MECKHSNPIDYLLFWGKADSGDEITRTANWHPAAFHMLDVAAVASAWLGTVQPAIPGLMIASPTYYPAITLMIALHDIGKISRPFQGKRVDLWPAVLGPYVTPLELPRHDSAGFAMLSGRLKDKLAWLMPALGEADRNVLLRAICGHHGRPPVEEPKFMTRVVCDGCASAAGHFIDDLMSLLKPTPLPAMSEPDVTAFGWWLAGLTVLADWIGSNEEWFAFAPEFGSLEDYWPLACKHAAAAIRQAGVLPIKARADFDIAALLPGTGIATPMQTLAGTLDLGPADASVLVIIEDQTGSGKTEAALLLAQRIMTEKSARGLFIALPTMATADALHQRLSTYYARLFAGGGETPSLVLAHGRRALNDRFMATLRGQTADRPIRAGADADETASAQCAGWIAKDRRRTFLADCGVGTIDQALHAVLPTRHAPLRLFGLCCRVLIIDEAHAYDTYMGEELFRLIAFQARLGGSTIILSATLPIAKRQKFMAVFREATGDEAATVVRGDYPLVTAVTAARMAEMPCAPRQELARDIEVERLADAEAALCSIVDAAARGAAIAWIRNTVDDAIEAQAMLAARGVAATLFHARFAMGDRLDIQEQVLNWFGKESLPPGRAHVVIGTQVMEQSLDIDVDLMVTDLAPVDLLLQRAGRLWRHQRDDRPLTAPRLLIVAPEPVADPPADWLSSMRGTKAVYRDPALLWRSARAIFAKPVLALPQDVRGLVEAAYAEDAVVPKGLRVESDKALGKDKSDAAIAGMNLLKWNEGYCLANGPWESDIHTPTRLSDPSLEIRMALWDGAGLKPWREDATPAKSWSLSEIALPCRRVGRVPDPVGAQGKAMAVLRRSWPRMEQDTPVLVMQPDGGSWLGLACDKGEREVRLRYTPAQGMTFL